MMASRHWSGANLRQLRVTLKGGIVGGKPLAMALNQVSNFMRKSLRSKMLVPLHHFVSLIISAPDTALICLSLDFYEAGVRLVDSRTPFSAPNKQGMVWICPSTPL